MAQTSQQKLKEVLTKELERLDKRFEQWNKIFSFLNRDRERSKKCGSIYLVKK